MKMCVKVFLEWDEPRINVTYNISLGGAKNKTNSICQGNLLKGIENKIIRIDAFRKLQSLFIYILFSVLSNTRFIIELMNITNSDI